MSANLPDLRVSPDAPDADKARATYAARLAEGRERRRQERARDCSHKEIAYLCVQEQSEPVREVCADCGTTLR